MPQAPTPGAGRRDPIDARAEAHADYRAWPTPAPRENVTLGLGLCIAAMCEQLPVNAIICHGANMLVLVIDNAGYGTIRMHQKRAYSGRISGTRLSDPDFAALGRAYGCWEETVESAVDFAQTIARAIARTVVKLLHLKTEVEQVTPARTLSAMTKAAPR